MGGCAGPYTRVPFEKADLKPITTLLDHLGPLGGGMTMRAMPKGNGGIDDFNFDFAVTDAGDAALSWEVHCAKFLGPKKTFSQSHVIEFAVRQRDGSGEKRWEGYLYFDGLKDAARDLPPLLRKILDGETPDAVVDPDDAQLTRIELCTGM
ncbi:MAG: hypothetical protein HQL35_09390 [Alphaproteobacteria bacterium]|nr:hypothetical protein [Alphaproteobacteria bacterium]